MLELDLGKMEVEDIFDLDIEKEDVLKVYIPLESIGVTNSYMDISDDYLEALWVGERLASEAKAANVVYDYISEVHKTRLCLMLYQPTISIKIAIEECVILYCRGDDGNYDFYQSVRDKVLNFELELDSYSIRLPEIADDYYANLIEGAYCEMLSESPELYFDEVKKHPERKLGYWRSFFSNRLDNDCYMSSRGWLIPGNLNLNYFFEVTGQKYRTEKLLPAEILVANDTSYVLADGLVAYFPMKQYLNSRFCSSLTMFVGDDEDEECWPPDEFDWSDGHISGKKHLTFDNTYMPTKNISKCMIDHDGTMVSVHDGKFWHVLYDTEILSIETIKNVRDKFKNILSTLSKNIDLPDSIAYKWGCLSDEEFEQLCYDIIFNHPRFNADTIRKYGKSRSRDGGRDIEVYDIPKSAGVLPRKWIFQCKLITNSKSLSATKLVDVGDMLERYDAQGFGVMTSAPIDATLYDKLDSICSKRGVELMNFSVLELERVLYCDDILRYRYFGK
ncbi:hypothetical protein EHN07_06650 [Buttiauxella warmboldiae]|uniref:Restriction endonuclease type IV Mrr domain-containing protein n=1 Tax=Buttiauxella warmboldiae TaxID=82993 RepID=A0A3N5EDZ5_9ENTR|nr:hypothetical protein [Buttiauxella warmboldiae]RPH29322.1 hypothetical protein EHN07_06650 [Buttiauxella warmboldiae]